MSCFAVANASGCSGGDGSPALGELGGTPPIAGNAATNSAGANASVGGATNAGGGVSKPLGGATAMGGSGQGGAAPIGGTAASTGAGASGAANGAGGGTRAVGGAGGNDGSGLGGITAAGGKTTGGANAMGGTATGGAKAIGGASTGGVNGLGGGATGGAKATGGSLATGGVAGALPAVTIYVAGDSTVSTYTDTTATNDQAGWGQMLKGIFGNKVTVVNRAAGGRTAHWFYLEGAVTNILNAIKPGDYFFIQFGTNDQNSDPNVTFTVNGVTRPRYAEASTTFKTQLKQYYLDPTKAKGAIPVLVTPPPRNSAYCNGGNGLSAYATAMKELGTAENVAVLDNNLKTFNYLKAICPKPTVASAETFFKNNAGSIDGTHFQENGARKMAGFIGEEIERIPLGLAAYLL